LLEDLRHESERSSSEVLGRSVREKISEFECSDLVVRLLGSIEHTFDVIRVGFQSVDLCESFASFFDVTMLEKPGGRFGDTE